MAMRYGAAQERRRYYSTSEILEQTGLDSAQLARLEKNDPQARPLRSRTGRKLYREAELQYLLQVAKLQESGLSPEEWEQRAEEREMLERLFEPIRELLTSTIEIAQQK